MSISVSVLIVDLHKTESQSF